MYGFAIEEFEASSIFYSGILFYFYSIEADDYFESVPPL